MGAVGRLFREEPQSIFTRGGVVRHGVRNAAQAACVPVRHIVKEVSCRLGVARFEGLLLSADGEPLGAPVRAIFEQACPCVGLFTLVIVDEV